MQEWITQTTQYIKRVLTHPQDELSRAQWMLRYGIDLCRHGARELRKDRAPQMAAALTYHTIFGLVPVAMISMLVFRAFVDSGEAQHWLQENTYQYLGWDISLDPAGHVENTIPNTATDPEGGAFRASVDAKIEEIVDNAWKLNVGNIGLAGIALLIWAALGLLVTVEDSFNIIYSCPHGRSWYSRITTYWAVVTLGPVLIFFSMYMAERAMDWGVHSQLLGSWTESFVRLLGRVAALGASWLLLFLVYALMPNTTVRWKPALLGSFVAALLWEIGKWAFQLYVSTALPYSALYGSLALIPIFLFWVYITWLIVLFGLEVTYTLQMMHGRQFKEEEASKYKDRLLCDPQWFIPMMACISRGFEEGRILSGEELSQHLGLPTRTVVAMANKLEEAKLVHRIQPLGRDDPGYALAQPPDRITLVELLDLGYHLTTNDGSQELTRQPGWQFVERLASSQRDLAGELTLASLLPENCDDNEREYTIGLTSDARAAGGNE